MKMAMITPHSLLSICLYMTNICIYICGGFSEQLCLLAMVSLKAGASAFDGSVHLSAWLLEVLGGEETMPGLIS